MAKYRIHKDRIYNQWYICRLNERGTCIYVIYTFTRGNIAIRSFARKNNGA